MKIALVGATGLVGGVMLDVLGSSEVLAEIELIPAASERSVGKEIEFRGEKIAVVSIEDAIKARPKFAIFSAGGSVSLRYAPEFAKVGSIVVDNSSAWRASKPLIVPQINLHAIGGNDRIIANPNCSTIQMVMVLAPLHAKYKIKRLIISTYQSVTGTGVKGINQLMSERRLNAQLNMGKLTDNNDLKAINSDVLPNQNYELSTFNPKLPLEDRVYPHAIDFNLIPHGGDFLENGYTSEEMKLVSETRKILEDEAIRITATVVRVPVSGGHSEAVNIEFENDFDINVVRRLLSEMPGVVVQDDVKNNVYPMPIAAQNRDEVFVGRIRRDESNERSLNLWIVADNLRKGAATNAVEIVESIYIQS